MTDIHGDFDGMKKLLEYAVFDPKSDQLVFGGDLINRGNHSGPVLKEVRRMQLEYPDNIHVVIGNHEEMMISHYQGTSNMWLEHGGKEALKSISKTLKNESELQAHIDWVTALPLVFEDDEFIYTHAGIDPYEAISFQSREILWMSEKDFYSFSKESILNQTKGKPVIHGHTPCEFIYFDGVRMNCDLGSNTYAILEERAIGLVDLTNMIYYVYKQSNKKLDKRKVSIF